MKGFQDVIDLPCIKNPKKGFGKGKAKRERWIDEPRVCCIHLRLVESLKQNYLLMLSWIKSKKYVINLENACVILWVFNMKNQLSKNATAAFMLISLALARLTVTSCISFFKANLQIKGRELVLLKEGWETPPMESEGSSCLAKFLLPG